MLFFIAALLILPLLCAAGKKKEHKVRHDCQEIFDTLFPAYSWVSEEDLDAFTELVAKKDNYFACPRGGGGELTNFSHKDLKEWFIASFNPHEIKYQEFILGDIDVTGNTCSFDKLFVANIRDSCPIQVMTQLVVQVDDHGKLVQWIDTFDEAEVTEKLGVCMGTVAKKETVPPVTVAEKCIDLFETVFPKYQWVSKQSLQDFTQRVATDQPNSFVCPAGGMEPLVNFQPAQLLEWFTTNFDPESLNYQEFILGDVRVTGNVCSFDKLFLAELGGSCPFVATSRLIMEIDAQGQLVSWLDHFDAETVEEKLEGCTKKLSNKKKKNNKKNKTAILASLIPYPSFSSGSHWGSAGLVAMACSVLVAGIVSRRIHRVSTSGAAMGEQSSLVAT